MKVEPPAFGRILMLFSRGVTGGWAGWAIAHPVFGRIEGAARQRYRAALLLAHPVLSSHLRPLIFIRETLGSSEVGAPS